MLVNTVFKMNERTKSPSTPKKFYKTSGDFSRACRLCGSVGDAKFAKNLFNRGNSDLLAAAEDVYGNKLPNYDTLPHLICRPCERRVNNFKLFKATILKSQTSFSRVKRCIPVSPSVMSGESSRKCAKTSTVSVQLFQDEQWIPQQVCPIRIMIDSNLNWKGHNSTV